jgi:LytR cell envelope-related transcriptional attenuator
MSRRALTSAVTLVCLMGVLVLMAVWGVKAATAPVAGDSGTAASGPSCSSQDQKVAKYVRRGEVTVSVYNSGQKSGRAQSTMDLLEQAGFKVGEVKNAPDGLEAERAAVYSTKEDDPAAELVARALGKATQVVHSDDSLGPGVDVVIGDKFKRLDPTAPKRLPLPKPVVTCD